MEKKPFGEAGYGASPFTRKNISLIFESKSFSR